MWSSILLLLCASLATSSISISQSSPSSRVVVKEGSPTTLSCRADTPWFLCLWTSPGREKQCAIREGNTTRSVCQGEAGLSLEGGTSSCSLTIDRVTREDWGQWMCLLQDPADFLTDRRLLEVQVARRGQLHLEDKGVLHLTEGHTLSLTCTVKDAFPRPSFSWLHSKGTNLTIQDSHLWQEQEHTFLSRSTVTFTALRNETNSSLSCLALQEEGGQELFRLSGRVVLEVAPLAAPLAYSLGSGVGVVLGVILTLVFLLLVCVAATAVMCRRQRQQQGSSRSSSSSSYQEDSLSPVWTTSRWPSRPGGAKKHVGVNVTPSYGVHVTPSYSISAAPSYSVVNLSGEVSSSQHSILTDSSPRGPSLAPAPSLHETHFSDSVEEPPVTLLHPPGLVLHLPPRSYSLLQGMDSRMAGAREGWPCCDSYYNGSRPVSSLGLSLAPPGPRDLAKLSVQTLPGSTAGHRPQTLAGHRPSSSTSLFHCPHDCFPEEGDHLHREGDHLDSLAREVQQAFSGLDM